jgi:uncharacterized membrane protein
VILLKKFLLKSIGLCSLVIAGLFAVVGTTKIVLFYEPEE